MKLNDLINAKQHETEVAVVTGSRVPKDRLPDCRRAVVLGVREPREDRVGAWGASRTKRDGIKLRILDPPTTERHAFGLKRSPQGEEVVVTSRRVYALWADYAQWRDAKESKRRERKEREAEQTEKAEAIVAAIGGGKVGGLGDGIGVRILPEHLDDVLTTLTLNEVATEEALGRAAVE